MVKLEERKQELEKNFNLFEEQKKKLVDKINELNKELTKITAEQIKLQGAYEEVNNIIKETEIK